MGGSPAKSVCVFCGSSDAARPEYIEAATALGRALAAARLKLVYGGGGVGLMGATAKAAHAAGGEVLGIIPTFLIGKERALETVEHVVVANMHERKMLMYERSDAFVILPGGIGTLEEVVELMSWRRLGLHHSLGAGGLEGEQAGGDADPHQDRHGDVGGGPSEMLRAGDDRGVGDDDRDPVSDVVGRAEQPHLVRSV